MSDTQLGTVRSAVFLASLLGQFLWGPLSDRLGAQVHHRDRRHPLERGDVAHRFRDQFPAAPGRPRRHEFRRRLLQSLVLCALDRHIPQTPPRAGAGPDEPDLSGGDGRGPGGCCSDRHGPVAAAVPDLRRHRHCAGPGCPADRPRTQAWRDRGKRGGCRRVRRSLLVQRIPPRAHDPQRPAGVRAGHLPGVGQLEYRVLGAYLSHPLSYRPEC